MTCHRITLGDGTTLIACDRTRPKGCKHCHRRATKQCDFPLAGKRAGRTCSAHLCDSCAVAQGRSADGDTVDYCPPHHRHAKAHGEQLVLGGKHG